MLNEVDLGGIPAWGGTTRLPRLVGRSLATDLILTGRSITGAEGHAIGLVHRLADDRSTMFAAAAALAAELVGKSASALSGQASSPVQR
jgi:enoyl-CoA hydratase/carnithine racemase